MKRYTQIVFWILAGIGFTTLFSCNKSIKPTTEGKFSFNIDTLTFDTVFTQVGSVTHQFLIYNNENKWLRLRNIRLGKGDVSPYRLNIDGQPTKNISNIDIAPNDSLWVFVAVTIDPTSINTPFLEMDSIVVETDNFSNYIPLVAYGQNAYYINDSVIKQNTVWTNDKPYVIVNSCLLDSGFNLTIPKGTRIYMHANSKLYILGTLQINGTKSDSVVFQGNRLDRDYFGGDIPGEWGGLYFHRAGKNSVLNYTTIKNCGLPTGIDGLNAAVYVDSCAQTGTPLVTFNNCQIGMSIGYGIFGYCSNIKATNCLIHTCGGNNVGIIKGGKYVFDFCSIVNYGYKYLDHKNTPILGMLNYFEYEKDKITYVEGADLNATFTNCIIYGNALKGNETALDKKSTWAYNLSFDHCLIRQTDDISSICSLINSNLNLDPLFTSLGDLDFSLSNTSPCKAAGKATSISIDIEDNPRGNPPSIGCYE